MTLCQNGTSGCDAIVVGIETVLDSVVEDVHVPAVHKIPMEAISGGISVAEHKLASGRLVDIIRGVEDF